MFLKFELFRVWYSILYTKLVDCIFFKIVEQHICFVIGMGTYSSWERNVTISPSFSEVAQIFTLFVLKSTEREVMSPCLHQVLWALTLEKLNYNVVKDEKKLLSNVDLVIHCIIKVVFFTEIQESTTFVQWKGTCATFYESRGQHKWRFGGTFY